MSFADGTSPDVGLYDDQDIHFDAELLDHHLRDITDCESSDTINEDLEPLPDLNTIRSKVGKVLWIYPSYPVDFQYVRDIRPPTTTKPQPYQSAQTLSTSIHDSSQKRSLGLNWAGMEKHNIGERHGNDAIRARDTVWEGRLRKRKVARASNASSRSKPARVKKRRSNVQKGPRARLKNEESSERQQFDGGP